MAKRTGTTYKRTRKARIDPARLAARLGIPLETLASMIGMDATMLRRDRHSAKMPPGLQDASRVYDALTIIFPLDETIASWMHLPLRSLDMTPIELAQRHGITALRALVEGMAAGGYL